MQCMEVWGGNEAAAARLDAPGLEAWVLSIPAGGRTGGDVHYVSSCATGRISRILLADVAGHGGKVAEVATTLRDHLRKFLNFVSQERVMQGLNRGCGALSEDGLFASAVVATYWAPNDRLLLSNAGHPRPLWYRARLGTWSYVDVKGERIVAGPRNVPLGVVEAAHFDQKALRLRDGDVIVLYTDALLEARGKDGVALGEAGLLAAVRALDPKDPEALARALVDRAAEAGGGTPVDDCTVLALRHRGEPPSLRGMGDALRGFARLAWDALRGRGPFPWPEVGVANLLGAIIPRANRSVARDAVDP